jgi:hypothetical protein
LSAEDRVALRALMRQELAAWGAARHDTEPVQEAVGKRDVPDSSTPTLEQTLALLTPDQRVTYDDASSLISDRIARQSWTDEDRLQLRDKVRSLPPKLALELTGRLIVAVNSGQIHPHVLGPVF